MREQKRCGALFGSHRDRTDQEGRNSRRRGQVGRTASDIAPKGESGCQGFPGQVIRESPDFPVGGRGPGLLWNNPWVGSGRNLQMETKEMEVNRVFGADAGSGVLNWGQA